MTSKSRKNPRKVTVQSQFGPTGIFPEQKPRVLNAGNREAVLILIHDSDISLNDAQGFFDDIAKAIGYFDAFKKLEKQTRPHQSRANLRRALKAALKLNEALNRLDGNAWQALGGTDGSGLRERLHGMVECLANGMKRANDFPNHRVTDFPRLELAKRLAILFESRLGVRATSTKGGLFVAILEIVASAATRRQTSVEDLARAAVSAIKKES